MRRTLAVPLVVALALAGMIYVATAQNPLPPNPAPTCTVTQAEFAKWFANGTVQRNGLVNPADSLNFTASSRCDFYKWSWQMFMWATSPQHPYGGKSLVFNSPVFYDVSPPGPPPNCERTFIANTGLAIKKFGLFRAQVNRKGVAIRLGPSGTIIHPEGGQATGDVLMAQTGSLVYYGVHVNDVYAYFLTGNKTGGIKPPLTTFPDNQPQLKQVTDYAKMHGKTFPDSKALVIELKTSWIEVTKLARPETYITLTAEVPVYNKTPKKWTPTGKTQQVKLAMVGMHVVGTVKNHPEMVWATFEHVGTAPNGNYAYLNSKNNLVTVPQNTAGSWLFCKSKSAGPFNQSHMQLDPSGNIVATPGNTISPSDTLLNNPWGQGTTANNTDIISLNNSVVNRIPAGDVRKNYVLIGALWTNGKIPGFDPANQVQQIGSLQLANATMETYFQFPTLNCFTCHSGSPGNGLGAKCGGGLSHIYGDIVPLKLK
jgi:hypothetical protein